jgi:hypothetical protein
MTGTRLATINSLFVEASDGSIQTFTLRIHLFQGRQHHLCCRFEQRNLVAQNSTFGALASAATILANGKPCGS